MTLREIKERVPLHQFASRYIQINLTSSTRRYTARCPFHDEKTASFKINTNSEGEEYFHCFGCHVGGDLFNFVARLEKCTYGEAVKIVCDKSGIVYRYNKEEHEAQIKFDSDSEKLSKIYSHIENLTDQAKDYIESRCISSTQEHLSIKWSESEETVIPFLKQIDEHNSLKLQSPWFWRTSLVFPVRQSGKIVNLYFRNIKAEKKEDRHRMVGGRSKGILCSDLDNEFILVEGVFDLLSLFEVGITNAACSFGTELEDQQIHTLARFTKSFIFFDNDENNSGIKGALKLASQLGKSGSFAKIIDLGIKGKDVNDLLKEGVLTSTNADKLKSHSNVPIHYKRLHRTDDSCLIDLTKNGDSGRHSSFLLPEELFIWKADNVDNNDRKGISCLLSAVSETNELILKDHISFWSMPSRSRIAKVLEKLLLKQLSIAKIERSLIDFDQELHDRLNEKSSNIKEEVDESEEFTEDELKAADDLLNSEDIIDRINEDLNQAGVVGEKWPKIMSYLIMTSRKSNEPLSGCIKAQSSTGKSFIMSKVIQCCPKDEVFSVTRATANALFYLKRDALQHKFFTIAELPGAESSEYTIRVMQSERSLVLLRPFKNEETGEMETREITIDGPIAYFTTTVEVITNQENDTRNIDIYLNESEEQTKVIQERQRYESSLEFIADRHKIERIFKVHRAAQKSLKTYQVIVPYWKDLYFPSQWTRNRRDNMKFLELIKTVCILRQKKKQVKTTEIDSNTIEYIEADAKDYEHAYMLATNVFESVAEEMARQSRLLLTQIQDMCQSLIDTNKAKFEGASKPITQEPFDVIFTRADIRRYTRLPEAVIFKYIKPLERGEYLRILEGGRGKTVVYKLSPGGNNTANMEGKLLSPIELKIKLEGGDPF